MDITFSHHRPRVARARPDVAVGWTVRATLQDGDTTLFDDITIACEAMPLDPVPKRSEVDAVVRDRLFLDGKPAHPHLVRICALFEDRRRFADVINFQLED